MADFEDQDKAGPGKMTIDLSIATEKANPNEKEQTPTDLPETIEPVHGDRHTTAKSKMKKRKSGEDLPSTDTNENHLKKFKRDINCNGMANKSAKSREIDSLVILNKNVVDIPGTSQQQIVPYPQPRYKQVKPKQRKREFKCCKKWNCLHVIDSQVIDLLYSEYHEEKEKNEECGKRYLRKYMSRRKREKINDGTFKPAVYDYTVPTQVQFKDKIQKKVICQKAFFHIFDVNEWTVRQAREKHGDDCIREETKGRPSDEDDVILVKTCKSANNSPQCSDCNCIKSSPVYFTATRATRFDLFKRITKWYDLYEIEDNTLEVLFNAGYYSVKAIEAMKEQDLESLNIIRGQMTLMRRFVQYLNCKQHPPVFTEHSITTRFASVSIPTERCSFGTGSLSAAPYPMSNQKNFQSCILDGQQFKAPGEIPLTPKYPVLSPATITEVIESSPLSDHATMQGSIPAAVLLNESFDSVSKQSENTSTSFLRNIDNVSPNLLCHLERESPDNVLPDINRSINIATPDILRILENASPNILRYLESSSPRSFRLTPSPSPVIQVSADVHVNIQDKHILPLSIQDKGQQQQNEIMNRMSLSTQSVCIKNISLS